jgi:hypothetical protein
MVFCAEAWWWARARNCPPLKFCLLILEMADDRCITQVCPASIKFRNRIGSCLLRLSRKRRPAPWRRDRVSAWAPDAGPECPPVSPHSDWSAGRPPPAGSQRRDGGLHVVEHSGHGVSPLAEKASSPYGMTDRGRPARSRRLMDQSAKPALPGFAATLPEAAQTALSRDQHGYGKIRHVTPHATSGYIVLQ